MIEAIQYHIHVVRKFFAFLGNGCNRGHEVRGRHQMILYLFSEIGELRFNVRDLVVEVMFVLFHGTFGDYLLGNVGDFRIDVGNLVVEGPAFDVVVLQTVGNFVDRGCEVRGEQALLDEASKLQINVRNRVVEVLFVLSCGYNGHDVLNEVVDLRIERRNLVVEKSNGVGVDDADFLVKLLELVVDVVDLVGESGSCRWW